YALLMIGGGNDLVATQFDVSLNAVTNVLRVAVFLGPGSAFLVTKRIFTGFQPSDGDRMLHGAESGIIDRAPSGKYSERHRPISDGEAFKLTQHEDIPALLPAPAPDAFSVKKTRREQRRRKATRFYFIDT